MHMRRILPLLPTFPKSPLIGFLPASLPMLCRREEVLNVCVRIVTIVDDVSEATEGRKFAI